ncbi:hypothetical protein KQ302_06625 [Synechococcus sp. CS-602]|uniref:hypothetical protein n=1 Tax=Synechococcaceae TaxID=1890426 RepID=UPI0008FF275F|nr:MULTISPECIES: hypothetical protein [Synechococcaceae]MCT4365998.1 hypothetical protein [Candidatus Regnicoccus frigidus MAG-AL1]APD49328.1 hypothetical protein BM449_04830 [Synechococcus sp. SynAce01]MCT0204775.1 hypothetical protein [Synechococcus sp. CS-602]MCT0247334.1 hypothetical protein [Synechococcus sp. CS-601]MCT4367529.1 hypothetical protein [Candidatus Regnicoccus frigidus MAG-AL2]
MNPAPSQPAVYRWIKTDCGRAQYMELASRRGLLANVRLVWFVLIAAIRDWPLKPAEPGA